MVRKIELMAFQSNFNSFEILTKSNFSMFENTHPTKTSPPMILFALQIPMITLLCIQSTHKNDINKHDKQFKICIQS